MSRSAPRGGRGGRSKVGTARIGGVDIAYDDGLEEHLRNRPQPTPLFPSDYKPLPPRPLSKTEKLQVGKFLAMRRLIHEGPLYAVQGVNAGRGPKINPFEGMQAYSQKYVKRRRTIPRLDTKARVLKSFPQELWSTLDPSCTNNSNGARQGDRSGPGVAGTVATAAAGVTTQGSHAAGSGHGKKRRNLLDSVEDDDEAGGEQQQQQLVDEEPPEEEVDDEYGSDEEEMAGDYNAEQYFDDGGDDAGDDYEAGEADAGDYS